MTTRSSAASFIDQIKAEYREVAKAEATALPHAIRCGEFLNLAKENLKAEKGGKWLEWLKTNCPEIAQTTASLYMRLAEHKKKVERAPSIREAQKLLPKGTRTPAAAKGDGGVDPPQETKARDISADLEVLAPDEVCKLLVDNWDDDDKLRQLSQLINKHLEEKRQRIAAAASSNPEKRPGATPSPTISNTVANPPPQPQERRI
jgi:hypothetical protein